MKSEQEQNSEESSNALARWLLIAMVLCIAVIEIFVSFRGLFEPAAMDQAQIARQIARGEGATTKFFRPLQLMEAAAIDKHIDFDHVKDVNYAPLHPYVLSLALQMTGADDFEANRMEEGGLALYGPDRVVAATSMVFFIIALFLSYLVAWKLFDEAVAAGTVLLMSTSSLLLKFATSGLAQPMMMCFFLGAVLLMILACEAQSNHLGRKKVGLYVVLSFCSLGLLCLSSWMGVWIGLGMLIFVGFFLRPYGVFSVVGFFVLLAFIIIPYMQSVGATGTALGSAFYAIYNNFGEGEELVLRSILASDLPLDDKNFFLRISGAYFSEIHGLFAKTGSIITVFFFFLSLFHGYRSKSTEKIKWASLIILSTAIVGTVFFGAKPNVNVSQIYVLLSPLMVAYGLSIALALLARRVKGDDFILVRNFAIVVLVIISAGPLLGTYPRQVYRGLWLGSKGIPHWPPYYPNALNLNLVDNTNKDDIIVTDQPWAVAWYADRKALWTPLKVTAFSKSLLPLIQENSCDVQGFLMTPSSYWQDNQAADSAGGLAGVMQKNGEFAPAAVEGVLLLASPKKNFFYGDLFDSSDVNGVGSLLSSNGEYGRRVAILGAHILYYAKTLD
ncbi:MAG: hypothetical protein R3Y56_01870 [Akkermansia sp.]